MEANQHTAHGGDATTSSPADARSTAPTSAPRSEDLFVRNHDVQRTYHLHLTARNVRSDEVFERQYSLQPGQVIAEFGVLPSGEYDLQVEIAHTATDTRCEVGPNPDETALVEVGNGTVTVTQGLY